MKAIKIMMKKIDTDIMLKRELVNREVRQTYQQNSGLILMKICDEEAKKIRMKARDKETRSNVRHYGDQVMMK